MKIITHKLTLAALISASLLAAATLYAAATSTASTTPATTSTATPTSSQVVKQSQTFQNGNLNVQIQYEDGKLIGMRLINTGKEAMDVNILKDNYVLGPNDAVVINPPNVVTLQIYHGPHMDSIGNTGALLPHRFSEHEIYNLNPETSDSSVTKSAPTPPTTPAATPAVTSTTTTTASGSGQ